MPPNIKMLKIRTIKIHGKIILIKVKNPLTNLYGYSIIIYCIIMQFYAVFAVLL
jgi:hypothetical protein